MLPTGKNKKKIHLKNYRKEEFMLWQSTDGKVNPPKEFMQKQPISHETNLWDELMQKKAVGNKINPQEQFT